MNLADRRLVLDREVATSREKEKSPQLRVRPHSSGGRIRKLANVEEKVPTYRPHRIVGNDANCRPYT